MRVTWIIVVLTIIGLLLVLGACSNRTDVPVLTLPTKETVASASPLVESVATPHQGLPTSTPLVTATTVQTPATGRVPVPGTDEVLIWVGEYRPASITIPVGTTVTWIGNDPEQHDVTSDTGLFSSPVAMGASFRYTFTEPGIFSYSCACDPGMAGVVIVK